MAAAENFGIILRKWGKRVRTRQTTRQYSTKNQYIFPAVTLLVEAPVFLFPLSELFSERAFLFERLFRFAEKSDAESRNVTFY